MESRQPIIDMNEPDSKRCSQSATRVEPVLRQYRILCADDEPLKAVLRKPFPLRELVAVQCALQAVNNESPAPTA